MIENTAEDRMQIMESIILLGNSITDKSSAVEAFRQYASAELKQRYDYDNLTDEQKPRIDKICEVYASLASSTFEHDFEALRLLFSELESR